MKIKVFLEYKDYKILKSIINKYKHILKIKPDYLDQGVMFFDQDAKYIEKERFEIENIIPAFILLPKFFWEENLINFEKLLSKNDPEVNYIFDKIISKISKLKD